MSTSATHVERNTTARIFSAAVLSQGTALARPVVETVQINIGKLCNQSCSHCHVEAGPKRKEQMTQETTQRVLDLLALSPNVTTIDLTGGAPELNPNFRTLVVGARSLGKHVIDRCNLTVLLLKGQHGTAEFLAHHGVEIIASLPCYSRVNLEKQRGRGVFAKSIQALQMLNKLGYGDPATDLKLNLVYNPVGAFLPPRQDQLEHDYRQHLADECGVRFNHLYTITNMPIARFREDLERSGNLESYMQLLYDNFNPSAAESVMCRSLVSVSWDGKFYDCDFNQMLDMPVHAPGKSLQDIASFADLTARSIATDDHCFGCTAGAGSSCGGALLPA